MKFLVLASVATAASAFTTPTMTFAVGRKTPAKKVAKTKAIAKTKAVPKKTMAVMRAKPAPKPKAKAVGTVPSTAIPGEDAPALLDGTMIGDVGFDPCYLSTKADTMAPYFNGLFAGNAPIEGLTWYREAELMHGRLAMMAATGFVFPGFATFPGNEWTGAAAFAETNPLTALSAAPSASLFQIFAFMGFLEFRRINIITEDGVGYMAGDSQRWGQGEGRWNPFGFNYTPEEYEEKQLQELKHGRAAMIGLLGLIFQANASGVGVVEQWSTAFTAPDYYAKAGYFIPEGI